MPLHEYRRKRAFSRTAEPEPKDAARNGQRAIFVVQLHHASRRHYDFRLQVGDALKSWAVPKGPSYDPKVKRMAVEVEDHPLDYAAFEGAIPKEEYGGGHVARFDEGVWSTSEDVEAQLAKGHLRFELFGSKLKGGWHLVRTAKRARQPQWLLFKDNDAFAAPVEADDLLGDVTNAPEADVKRAGSGKSGKRGLSVPPVPKRRQGRTWARRALALTHAVKGPVPDVPFVPQLATAGEFPPSGEQWIHEVKWDGYRIVAIVADGEVRLWSRNALEWTGRIPEIRDAVMSLGLTSAVLDGELIAGGGTRQDFNLLQAILAGERQGTLTYALFDLLHLDGVDIADAPLVERKELLRELLQGDRRHLAYSSHVDNDGDAAYRLASEHHYEGIISKRADRGYLNGRSADWRKTKQLASDEFAVVGYTAPKGSRTGFGALLLATPDAVHAWRYAGRVGSGFTASRIDELIAMIGKAGRSTPSVHIPAMDTDLRSAKWFAPRFVVEVFYRGIGRQQLLRQPSFKAVRHDKTVAELQTPGADAPAMRDSASAAPAATARRTRMNRAGKRAASPPRATPVLSSPDKVLFRADGITKQDVWDYYVAVMHALLPEVIDRPLSIVRCPGGTDKACFFQKHHTAGLERVDAVQLKEESGREEPYLVVRDEDSLLELVQFNTLEFHPWGSRASRPDLADRVVFDLDPGPGVMFDEVKRAARDIRRLLEQLGLTSFLRVSGGKGLHVVVPLNPGCAWDLTRRFAKGFADALAQSQPDRFLSTGSKRLRNRRIFVDYLRNGRGATAVACYSLRARDGAPVAMPIGWNELARIKRADAFTIRNVPAKLRRRRKDPWQGFDTVRQDLRRWQSSDV